MRIRQGRGEITMRFVAALAWLATAALLPAAAAAQEPAASLQASRAMLDQLLVRLEAAQDAPDSSTAARARARSAVATVRFRLSEGDFQPGDRIAIRVEGTGAPVAGGAAASVEQQLSDTFTVRMDRDIALPVLGVMSLRGVLRSEVREYLAREIGRFIREPVVYVQPLIRVSVVGAVARPGFYAVAPDAVLSDVLMVAGGPGPDARMNDLRIERSGERLWAGAGLQQALVEGRTLDAMSIRPGDTFVVPRGKRTDLFTVTRTVAVILSIPITVYTLTRIFK